MAKIGDLGLQVYVEGMVKDNIGPMNTDQQQTVKATRYLVITGLLGCGLLHYIPECHCRVSPFFSPSPWFPFACSDCLDPISIHHSSRES